MIDQYNRLDWFILNVNERFVVVSAFHAQGLRCSCKLNFVPESDYICNVAFEENRWRLLKKQSFEMLTSKELVFDAIWLYKLRWKLNVLKNEF